MTRPGRRLQSSAALRVDVKTRTHPPQSKNALNQGVSSLKRPFQTPGSLDEARLMPRFHDLATRDREQAAVLARAIGEAHAESRPAVIPGRVYAAASGELRGIPAIGRGVSGASPGTRPDVDGVNRADRARNVEPMVAFL